jgi:photosystem II stability/assembly factor-like uncharacterized protein
MSRSVMPSGAYICALLLSFVLAQAPESLAAQRPRVSPAPTMGVTTLLDTATSKQLKWRHIGPEGNRITSVTGVPGDRTTYYGGAASGGLWKTTDGGIHWFPVFDDQPVSSVGSLAVAPSDHSVVWAGTGEPFIRSHISIGWGVYKSGDAGKTWTKMGLDNTGRISRIVVHPTNPDIVYVAALGHAYGPQPDRGIFRTMDGGKTWEKVLFVNDSTGASDIIMDPNNPRVLFAGMWQIEIHTWGRTSGGPGSGIWMSRDGGTTWKRLKGNGLPAKEVGKIGLGMSKANSDRIYALIETGDGVPALNQSETEKGRLWRSDDGGTNWQMVNSDRQMAGRTHYYNRMGVTPDNPDEAYFLAASWSKTLDGGRTIIDPPFDETPSGDHHDIWIDPTNGNRQIVSSDGGISITENRGKSWNRVQLPVAQMYHVTVDNRVPYNVYGNRQDGPSTRGPSNSKMNGFGIQRGQWSSVGGGESGWATPDPVDSNLVWSSASGYGSVGGIVSRWDARTNMSAYAEVWPQATIGHSAEEVKYRFVWTFPLTISPHDHNRVYVGSQHVHVTTDGGRSWQEISPDLTRNDRSRMKANGGLTQDNIGVEYSGVVFAIAESKLKAGLIWAGTNDGKVQLTQDAGKTWTDVSANLPNAPQWGTISNIEPSKYDEGTAYLSIDAHQSNSRDPFIYKTTDYGKTWRLLVAGIPKSPLSYVHIVTEDPVRRGLLYAGTENGIYVSFNDAESWEPLQTNLPHAPVYSITVQEPYHDLVIATYGRGFWILDDISPLRTLSTQTMAADLHLFPLRQTYRLLTVETPFVPAYDPVVGTNPPDGATLNYWLKTASKESKDSAAITVSDAAGKVVRTMKGPSAAGLNRAWWDLRTDLSKEVKLRTAPLFSPEIKYPPEGRSAPGVGRNNWGVAPGTYTVKVKVGDKEQSQQVVVKKDPNSGGSEEEIKTQIAMAEDIKTDVDTAVSMINALEVVRSQILTLKATLGDDDKTKDVRSSVDSLDKKLVAVEEQLMQMRVTGRGQDLLRWPYKLTEQLLYLGGSVTSSDYGPTKQHREVQTVLKEQLKVVRAQFQAVMTRDLDAFKQMLRSKNIQNAIISEP